MSLPADVAAAINIFRTARSALLLIESSNTNQSHGDVSANIVSCQSELERSFSCYALPDVSHVGLYRGQIVLGDQGVDELDPLIVRSDLLRRPQNQYGQTFSIHRRLTL